MVFLLFSRLLLAEFLLVLQRYNFLVYNGIIGGKILTSLKMTAVETTKIAQR